MNLAIILSGFNVTVKYSDKRQHTCIIKYMAHVKPNKLLQCI